MSDLRPLPTDMASLPGLLDMLTGRDLETDFRAIPLPVEPLQGLIALEHHRVSGISTRAANASPGIPPELLEALRNADQEVGLLAVSDGESLTACVSAPTGSSPALARALHAQVGGPEPARFELREDHFSWTSWGCLMGLPRKHGGDRDDATSTIDALADGLRGTPFLLAVLAVPEPREATDAEAAILRQAGEAILREHLAHPEQPNANPLAVQVHAMIDFHLRERATAGLWRCSIIVGARSAADLQRAMSLAAGAWGPTGTLNEVPLRTFPCRGRGSDISAHRNLLTSERLATLFRLPRRESAGFSVRADARFAVEVPSRADGTLLGALVDGQRPTSRPVRVPTESLCKHALVVGHPGSGKSTTVRNVLVDLAQRGIPFLVIDPVKGDYRQLGSRIPNLTHFQVGRQVPDVVPFRMNPFAFPEGHDLHAHVDVLKQSFIAAFGLVPPAPFLLEEAILHAYEQRGWDLATGESSLGHDPLAFPTLSELLTAIHEIVDGKGYSTETTQDLRTALVVRVASLCRGAKGASLDTRDTLPDELLFSKPALVELAWIGSAEEKAFIISVMLTRLLELRCVKGARAEGPELEHLLVIEEAHRLLKASPERSAEHANMAHHAVETFVNLMAEVRAYGQGVMVVEQVPSKLATEVIKHAGLKVVHRLTSKDDRDLVGDAMVLTEDQKRELALLPVGEAVCHSDATPRAIRVRVPYASHGAAVPGVLATSASEALAPQDRARVVQVLDRAHARGLITNTDLIAIGARYVRAVVAGTSPATARLVVAAVVSDLLAARDPSASIVRALTNQAVEEALAALAIHHAWSRDVLRHVLSLVASDHETTGATLRAAVRCRRPPHPWCGSCPSTRQWSLDAELLARTPEVKDRVRSLLAAGRDLPDVVAGMRALCGERLGPGRVDGGLVACGLGKVLHELGVRPATIVRTVGAAHDFTLRTQQEEPSHD